MSASSHLPTWFRAMAPRSITDEEIALIKAMKVRSLKNADIQFYFNRPERKVNSGRISGIWSGAYSNSAQIDAATPDVLDQFLATHDMTIFGSPVVAIDADPMSPQTLTALFGKVRGQWRLKAGESDEHECKEGFTFHHPGKWLRAVAALANNRGGYILFGVHDNDEKKENGVDMSHAVIGLNSLDFQNSDTVKFAQALTSTFDPTPRVRKGMLEIGGLSVGVLYVDAHRSRPVIATKPIQDIKEGDIYFRYPAQSRRIKYSDLRAMLDGRDAETRRELVPMVERLLALGPKNALIANLEAGMLEDGKHVIRIDESELEKLKFIKEGQFVETGGAPAIRLLGDLKPSVTSSSTTTSHITKSDLMEAFLSQSSVSDPKQYIRLLVEATQDRWLPFFFLARQAGMSDVQLSNFCMSLTVKKARRVWFCERANGLHSAYARVTGASVGWLAEINSGEVQIPKNRFEANAIAGAIKGLKIGPPVSLVDLLNALRASIAITNESAEPGLTMTTIRRALCRLDELYFAE